MVIGAVISEPDPHGYISRRIYYMTSTDEGSAKFYTKLFITMIKKST